VSPQYLESDASVNLEMVLWCEALLSIIFLTSFRSRMDFKSTVSGMVCILCVQCASHTSKRIRQVCWLTIHTHEMKSWSPSISCLSPGWSNQAIHQQCVSF